MSRPSLVILWVVASSLSAWAHRTEIEQVSLIEIGGRRFAIQYAAPPPGLGEFGAPILPPHCQWVDQEDNPIQETATSLVFEAAGKPLTAEDHLILPWQRNGVLVEARWLDGSVARQFFTSTAEGITVELGQLRAGSGSWLAMGRRYTELGVEHILGGLDHLMFVAGLLLLVSQTLPLIKTITAFTLAHSVTLALSVLGWIDLSSEPVEAIIALSIVLLAVENVHHQHGRDGLTARMPWLVALLFGLIHGLGFAGALGELGLPPAEVAPALLFFNLGVELGQLAFVGAWLALVAVARRMRFSLPQSLALVPHYILGSIASFWFLERALAMLP
jgi:hypothetical protein